MGKLTDQPQTGRRGFLKGIMVLGGTAVLIPMAVRAPESEPTTAPAVQSDPKQTRGYHVTPHISSYYEKAAL